LSILFYSFNRFSSDPLVEHLACHESYDRHEESEEVWRHRVYLFESERVLECQPCPDTYDDREESRDSMDFFTDECHSKWDEGSGKSDLVGIFYHFEYTSLFLIVFVRDEAHDDEEKSDH
jgi:hypothetical protein